MSAPSASQRLRLHGALFGAAAGDALGLYTEFMDRAYARQVYGHAPRFSLLANRTAAPPQVKQDRHRMQFPLSGWTDDMDQTLLILLSFLTHGDIVPSDVAHRFLIWIEQGLLPLDRLPLDYGMTFSSVVRSLGYKRDPSGIARRKWESGGRRNAANGAVMRTSVVGALRFADTSAAIRDAIALAQLTHADPRCLVSCAIVSALVAHSVRGEPQRLDVEAIMQRAVREAEAQHVQLDVPTLQELQRHTAAEVTLESLQLDDSWAMGYTFKTLGAAIWALRELLRLGVKADSIETILTRLVMQAGDADTNATVAGALLGAYAGVQHLPRDWLDGLRDGAWLHEKAEQLCARLDASVAFAATPDLQLDGGKAFLTSEQRGERERALQARLDLL